MGRYVLMIKLAYGYGMDFKPDLGSEIVSSNVMNWRYIKYIICTFNTLVSKTLKINPKSEESKENTNE